MPKTKQTFPPIDFFKFENEYWPQYRLIAGIDEAGRGAWAGPVVAAAVVFEPGVSISGVDDSKKLTSKKRELLFDEIIKSCLCYQVGIIESDVIDQINILQATKKAMIHAVTQLSVQPNFLFIDGNAPIETQIPQKTIIDGDALSHSIAAASILAKVTRDRIMVELSQLHPKYGFEKHKGYGTKDHQEALNAHGCLSIHRKSYSPIKLLLGLN